MNGDVLFCGAWDEGPGYPRVSSLRQGLAAAGVGVRECRAPGLGTGKQRLLKAPWRWPSAWWSQREQRRHLCGELRAMVARQRPRCIVVPYPGHALVHAIKAATDVPVVLDLFLSAYDTVVEDRAMVAPGSLAAWWLQRLDSAACAAADVVLLDTPAHAAYVAALTGVPEERFAWLPVHDPDAPPAPAAWPRDMGPLRLLFFGTGVPLHGLPVLIDAVARVPAVQLTLVGGTAAERGHARTALGDRLVLEPEFVPRERLHELLARSQLVAGVFGSSGKAQRVVPWKLVHALAAGRPVLTAETPAVCGWLDGSGALFFVPAADAGACAAALQGLCSFRERIAAAASVARATYDRHFGTGRLAQRWQAVLQRLDGDGAREVPA